MYEQMGAHKSGIVSEYGEISEEKLGAKMKIPKHLEEAAVGAAMYRMIACGEFKNAKELFSITREFNIIFKERLNRTDMVV